MECVDNPSADRYQHGAVDGRSPSRSVGALQIAPHAVAIVMRSADGYSASLPLASALQRDVLVAYGMNGQTLTAEPWLSIPDSDPGLFGFKSVKWVTEIQIGSSLEEGLCKETGGLKRPPSQLLAASTRFVEQMNIWWLPAWLLLGTGGFRKVEVRTDRGAWIAAHLIGRPLSDRLLATVVGNIPRRGASTIEARATDGADHLQTAVVHGSYPDGATGYARRSGPF